MKSRKTRKSSMPTVEGLHASFDKISAKVKSMIEKGATDSKLLNCIKNAWMEQFHMDLSLPAVKGMIMHYRAVNGSSPGSKRKTRKQRGGMAPIDFTMGQGVTDHVYGRFPIEIGTTPQVVKALDLGRFYESTGGRGCNATGGHAAPAGMQGGGGLFDAVMQGHAPASVPRNFIETGVSTVQGAPIMNPAASPISAHPNLSVFAPKPYDPGNLSSIASLAPVFKGY